MNLSLVYIDNVTYFKCLRRQLFVRMYLCGKIIGPWNMAPVNRKFVKHVCIDPVSTLVISKSTDRIITSR